MTNNDILKVKPFIHQPLIPLADNFTPRERTPWGGTNIASWYKKWLNLPPDQIIGESWEISGHPSFPNRFVFATDSGPVTVTLPQLLQAFPVEILGAVIAKKFNNRIPLLLKLLDAQDNLSVQVHPNDGYRNLKPGEMGKTEAWYIVASEPGSGLYLGLAEGVTQKQLEQALQAGDDISGCLNFVEVQPGDIYFIPAGTIHAIGQGVTLIEPQQTSETTYRFWDWNRKYNEQGEPSSAGKPRPLHIADSLAVTNFQAARGQRFIEQIKGKPELIFANDGNRIERLIKTSHFVVERISLADEKPFFMAKDDFFVDLIVIQGTTQLTSETAAGKQVWEIPTGQSVLIPACVSQFELTKRSAEPVEIIKAFYPVTV